MTGQFGAQSTTDEVLEGCDLTRKRVLVTGVSAGLGVETVRTLVAHGATVVGTARDLGKARAALPESAAGIELVEVDLASLASIRSAADELNARGQPLDAIIANAGIMACPYGQTADGFELQFGTNHLGHFVLVNRIARLLRDGGRLVNLSSRGHRMADVDLDDPGFERADYDPLVSYGRSKTANILFAVEFDRRFRTRGIRAAAVHPGGIRTELTRHMTSDLMERLRGLSAKGTQTATPPGLKSVEQGAATSVWAGFVASADEVGGQYCEDCHVAEVAGAMAPAGVQPYALDPVRAKALWTKSEAMVGERFPE